MPRPPRQMRWTGTSSIPEHRGGRMSRALALGVRRAPVLASFLLALSLAPLDGAAAQGRCTSPSPGSDSAVTLVLSGGGARGLAHIGVLRVLDSLGITPR